MDPITEFVVIVASLVFLGVLSERILEKTGIPDGVWLILAGFLAGPVSGLVSPSMLAGVVPYFGAIALVVLVLAGGMNLNIVDVAQAAPRGILLGVLTFALSVGAVMGFGYLGYRVGKIATGDPMLWAISGAILGGTSSAIIFPTLARLTVDSRVGRLLEIESSATDALCIVVATSLIDMVTSSTVEVLTGFTALGRQLGLGLAAGVLLGMAVMPVVPRLRGRRHTYPMVLGISLVLYALTQHAGGSGALAVLAFAMIIGNTSTLMARLAPSAVEYRVQRDERFVAVEHQIGFFIKAFFFTLIGVMLPLDPSVFLMASLVVLLLLIIRFPAVWLATAGSGIKPEGILLLAFGMPRGIAAGVLAALPAYAGIAGAERLVPIAFAVIAISNIVFAAGFTIFRPRGGPDTAPGTDGPAATET